MHTQLQSSVACVACMFTLTYTVVSAPPASAESSTYRVYVVNQYAHALSVLDGTTHELLSTTHFAPPSGEPTDMAASVDGAFLYFPANAALLIMDAASYALVASIANPDIWDFERIVMAGDGSHAYVLSSASVFVVDMRTREISPTASHIPGHLGDASLALSPDGARLYVTWTTIPVEDPVGSLLVLDTHTWQPIGTLELGYNAGDVAVRPDGAVAYVAGDSLRAVDTSTLTATLINLEGRPGSVAFSPDGMLAYVAVWSYERQAPTIAVVDATAHRQTAVIEVPGSYPLGRLTVSPDGRVLYFIVKGPNGPVLAIDAETGSIVSTTKVSEGPVAITVAQAPAVAPTATPTPQPSPASSPALSACAYVLHGSRTDSGENFSVIDLKHGWVAARLAVGDFLRDAYGRITGDLVRNMAISPDRSSVYLVAGDYGGGDGAVTIVDTATATITDKLVVGIDPWYLVFDPIRSLAYVMNHGDSVLDFGGSISVIDTATRQVIDTVSLYRADEGPMGLQAIAVTPDGSELYVGQYPGRVTVIDAATRQVAAMIPTLPSPIGMLVNPNGSTVYVVGADTGRGMLSVVDTRTKTIAATVDLSEYTGPMGITPDGAYVYVAFSTGSPDFYSYVLIVDAATNTVAQRIRLPAPAQVGSMRLTGDGSIAYLFQAPQLLGIDTGLQALTISIPVNGSGWSMDLSPDESLAYVANYFEANISVVDLEQQRTVNSIAVAEQPALLTVGLVRGDCQSSAPITPPPTSTPILIPTPPLPSLEVSSATGAPGEQVEISVTLHPQGRSIAGVQNNLSVSAPLRMMAAEDGRPACTVNPSLKKEGFFAFEPSGCSPEKDCDGLIAIVFALDNLEAISGNPVVYTCQVAIAANAAPGQYEISLTQPFASDPLANPVALTATNGTISVSPDTLTSNDPASVATGSHSGCTLRQGGDVGWCWTVSAPVVVWLLRRRKRQAHRTTL
jgi:YVTN family beta-propeller protein